MLSYASSTLRRILIATVFSCGIAAAANVCCPPVFAAELSFPLKARRIVFFGDSITHSGHYISQIEAQLRLQGLSPLPEIINIGLSSETCSGLSEPEHPFPRPNVQDRLDKALELLQPDVIVACYGMNDGIYHPFDEARFKAYQAGIQRIIDRGHAIGAKVVLLTPPPFDPMGPREKGKTLPPGEKNYAYFAMFENYDDVLKRYGQWIMQQADNADMVINVHRPMSEFVAAQRKQNPNYTFTPDGIHPTPAGHAVMADAILTAWGVSSRSEVPESLSTLISRRGAMLHDAWLSHIGHSRPGVKAGLPLEEAQQKSAELEQEIESLVADARNSDVSERTVPAGRAFQVHYPATLEPGKLSVAVDYYVWLPPETKMIRGIIVHQHGCGEGACRGGQTAIDDLHWQELARRTDCALFGSSYEPREGYNCRLWCDPRNGSADTFLRALDDFAQASGQPELISVPWCLWGHSGGGFWASLMQTLYPDRIVAIWLQSGTAYSAWNKGEIPVPDVPAAAYQVPVMGNPGRKEQDHPRFQTAWNGTLAMQAEYRKKGAPFFEFAPDPLTGHECGDSRYLSIPFFQFWLEHRLPDSGSQLQQLQPVNEAALTAWRTQMAPRLEEFIATGSVGDTSPPPAPTAFQAERQTDGTIRLSWQARADFESGLSGFILLRDGQELTTLPDKPVKRFGRPLFQSMSYHDTPEQPLPRLEYVDRSVTGDSIPRYELRAINSVGLKSDPVSNR